MSTNTEPTGTFIGTVDEYGTIWSGLPGASSIIGDVVFGDLDETSRIYLDMKVVLNAVFADPSATISGNAAER